MPRRFYKTMVTIFLILLIIAAVSYNAAFCKRCDKNPLLKYFTAEDFNLSVKNISSGKLHGCIYQNENVESNDKIIVFVHGMGPGHIAYTTEIAGFCNLGYKVLALDSFGCNMSEGKKINGIYEGVKTAVKAVELAHNQFGDKKIYLVGHSWGAYSAMCASVQTKVDGVVAISAPNTPAETIKTGATPVIGKVFAASLRPFWWIVGLMKFGVNGNANAAKSIKKSKTPALLIHGDSDKAVPLQNSAFARANSKNVQKLLAEGKAHNPYNTERAEKKLAELSSLLSAARNMTEEEKTRISKFDFTAATEEDDKVMNEITKFLKNI